MSEPTDLMYTDNHEWVAVKDDTIVIGITDYWQHRLSDITQVELPEPDDHHYEADEDMGVVESLEIATDFHAPVSGVITAINTELLARPEIINADPYGDGWLVKMKPDNIEDVEDLLHSDEYEAGLPEEADEEE